MRWFSRRERKYVGVRRYLVFLEESIDRGLEWTVFEPNAEPLWVQVRRDVMERLDGEWRAGKLRGTKSEEAYFVRCDRTTMTQNDLDNGRLILLVGVALLKPAEFEIFRIERTTS